MVNPRRQWVCDSAHRSGTRFNGFAECGMEPASGQGARPQAGFAGQIQARQQADAKNAGAWRFCARLGAAWRFNAHRPGALGQANRRCYNKGDKDESQHKATSKKLQLAGRLLLFPCDRERCTVATTAGVRIMATNPNPSRKSTMGNPPDRPTTTYLQIYRHP
jgi:hypothetical protein